MMEKELRSPAALTMASLGLLSENQMIARRLVNKLGKVKATKTAAFGTREHSLPKDWRPSSANRL
jgi:hypothetical protein